MKWKKLGRLFCPDGSSDWMVSHAAVPTADPISEHLHRVYFASRDAQNRSRTAFLEIDLRDPFRILRLSTRPVLDIGDLGTFDESGAMPSWLVDVGDRKYLYYIGWNVGSGGIFRNSVGLAISGDRGRTFQKYSRGPILDRDTCDPCFATNPCVRVEGNLWRMWYLACFKWEMEAGKPKHYYHIRYAESDDGIRWRKTGRACIDFKSREEHAISRPCVLKDADMYRMWYSCRGKSYRIGYAESPDGLEWVRRDEEAGIDVSTDGWDSGMIAYPFVFDHGGGRYMLYDGNGYGKTGFGLAVLEERV